MALREKYGGRGYEHLTDRMLQLGEVVDAVLRLGCTDSKRLMTANVYRSSNNEHQRHEGTEQ